MHSSLLHEYNRSIPRVLKNAIDWASRPYGDNASDGKVAAIISASIGMIGSISTLQSGPSSHTLM